MRVKRGVQIGMCRGPRLKLIVCGFPHLAFAKGGGGVGSVCATIGWPEAS